MNPLDNPAHAHGWFTRGAPLLLALLTVVAVALPMTRGAGVSDFDGFMSGVLFASLTMVSVASLVQTRLIVLPGMIRQFREQSESPTADSIAQLSKTTSLLAFAFSVAPGTYGVVLSAITGLGVLALPIDIVGFVIYFVLSSYLSSELDNIRLEWKSRGAP